MREEGLLTEVVQIQYVSDQESALFPFLHKQQPFFSRERLWMKTYPQFEIFVANSGSWVSGVVRV